MASTSLDTPRTSPWLSMWLSPRPTIAHIVASDPRRQLWLLAALGTIGVFVFDLLLSGWTTELLDWQVFATVAIVGAIAGIVSLYVAGFLLRWSGRLFGGHAMPAAIRAAVAWGQVPYAIGLAICLVTLLAVKFAGAALSEAAGGTAILALQAIVAVLVLWSLAAVLLMLARVQDFGFWRTIMSVVLAWVVGWLLVALLFAMPIRTLLFQPFNIPSGSMMPTLLVGDYLFVAKYPYGYTRYSLPFAPPLFAGRILGSPPQRGDVVVYRLPTDDRVDYISRIVGLPGDRIQMIGGRLHINGEPVKRERVADFVIVQDGRTVTAKRWRETLPNGVSHDTLDLQDNGFLDNTPVYNVPPGHYFMMGDNRDNATDSRVLNRVGYVPFDNLVGRASVIFFSRDLDNGGAMRAERLGMAVR